MDAHAKSVVLVPKVSAKSVDYMELKGAVKDADCEHVEVSGGVSSDLGCCNDFDPDRGAKEFKCGTCEYLIPAEKKDKFFG
jgi:hypothetical protein